MLKSEVFDSFKKGNIDVFRAIRILETDIENKKNEGVVYTPKYIADHIISNIDYKTEETIFEPSVGHGIFIFSLIEYVQNTYKLNNEEMTQWFNEKVFANELSQDKIDDFLQLLKIYFHNKGISNISFNNITCGDTLMKEYNKKFDVLIGNPPYIRTKNLESQYLKKLREKFISCKQGNVDIFYAFIELSTEIADRSSMIVPHSFINNKSAYNLRKIIKPYINDIIDFKSKLIFDPVRTYTCIYKLDKNKSDEILYSNDLNDFKKSFNKESLLDEHWIFEQYEKSKLLPDNTLMRSGIATLKDKVYIIENPQYKRIEEREYVIHQYEGKEYLIEKEATIDFFKITKMNKEYRIISPYDEKFNIIKEEELAQKYPCLYEFLKNVKQDLNTRDKGKTTKYESWYAYGRKQGLFRNEYEHHLLLPLMTTLPMKAIYIEKKNNFLFSSGYVLSFVSKEDALHVKEILESDNVSAFIKRVGKEWPGKEKYYTYSITQLRDI